MSPSDRDILAGWSRLGIAWNVPPADSTLDVERLLLRSLSEVPGNARMIVLVASWLSVYWRCVGRDRLAVLAQAATVREQATLGVLLETVDEWLPTAVFTGLRGELARMDEAEPLLRMDRQRPALARLAELEASAVSRRWGLWCLPIERKLEAVRPADWTWHINPALRIRSFFKGALKTSLLSAMDAREGGKLSITGLARECGVTRKAVYDAMEDLQFSKLAACHAAKSPRPSSAKP